MRRDWPGLLLIVLLPLVDLWWNLAHLNIGLVDFYGLSAFAQGCASHGAWPATPYFPAGYPLLLIPFGYLGSTLIGGYILSAIGIMLALYAAWMLARQMGVDRPSSVAVVLLCWFAPVCRVVSGSPSVDALYTGFGLWFLASAIAAWRLSDAASATGQSGLSRWMLLGLLLPALALPLLRYHALVLLVPTLLILALARRNARLALCSLLLAALATAFNYSSYFYAYHEAQPSVAGIQVLTGLELSHHKLYPSGNDSLWNDYAHFCEVARSTPILSIYPAKEVASSWLRNWMMFLRQPSVLMLFLLLAAAGIFRRPLPQGAALGLTWVLLYTLVLALTYYTARSAALPVMLATTLCLAVAHSIAATRIKLWLTGVVAVLLVCGFFLASGFAAQDWAERLRWANYSCWLNDIALLHLVHPSDIAVSDWRLLPLHNNAWTAPFATTSGSWIDDPAIHPLQRQAISRIAAVDLMLPKPPVQFVVTLDQQSKTAAATSNLVAACRDRMQWIRIATYQDTTQGDSASVFAWRAKASPASGAVPAAP